MSDDEWRELFVERVSDEIIDRIEGLAALRATLRPRCAGLTEEIDCRDFKSERRAL